MVVSPSMKAFFYTLISFVVLLSCSSSKTIEPQLKRTWMLIEFSGYTKEEMTAKHAQISIDTEAANHYTIAANMGCNSMRYQATPKNSFSFILQPGVTTEMACTDMGLEHQFYKMFKGIVTYEIKGHFLILKLEDGKQLKFIAADWD